METRYRALRTIATIFKVLGWVILILGILSACGSSALVMVSGSAMMGLPGAGRAGAGDAGPVYSLIVAAVIFIVMIVTVGLYALVLIAASEGIHVFLDIEENTREMVRRLSQRSGGTAPPPPSQ